MAKIVIKTHMMDSQRQFITDIVTRFIMMFGGYGSGKTHALVLKMFQLAKLNPGLPGGMCCPDYGMFYRDVMPIIEQICAENNIIIEEHKGKPKYLYIPELKVKIYIFHGADKGKSIRGPNLAWILLNEVTLLDWETAKACFSRVRLKAARVLQVAGSGTPEDFNWCYDKFIDKPIRNSKVIYADSRKNAFTEDGYIDMLIDSYDADSAKQYVGGQWGAKEGRRAAHKFDRTKHASNVINYEQGWGKDIVTVDFNVYPMAATIWQYNQQARKPLRVIDDIRIEGSDTWELCQAIKDKLPETWESAEIYPDGIGGMQKRTTAKSNITDIQIMRDEGFGNEEKGGGIFYKTRLSVRDCLNSANNLFSKNMIEVSSKAKNFIRDMERCKIKVGSYEIDKTDPELSHWLDGFKNFADYRFPVTKGYTRVRGQQVR
jgi:hypothetical protein